jgi:hypothetical protein
MSEDTSVSNPNEGSRRIADALLRATGGSDAILLMPPAIGDATDAGQLGINTPQLQQAPLGPVVFRRTRATMAEGQESKYELLVSGSAVQQLVAQLQLTSADALFELAGGVIVSGGLLQIEAWSSSQSLGQAYMYRLLLREAEPQSMTSLA